MRRWSTRAAFGAIDPKQSYSHQPLVSLNALADPLGVLV
jgi:hypothetical protein